MKLKELLQGSGAVCLPEQEAIPVTGVKYDSRKVEKGDLFVCFSGDDMDEDAFAREAAARGAAAILAEHRVEAGKVPVLYAESTRKALSRIAANYYGNPSRGMWIFGVTGTNGKTTISYMLKSIIEKGNRPCGVVGTIGYDLNGKKYNAANTTPEAPELERILREMRDRGVGFCAMEVSSHALQLSRTDDIKFNYVIFTNLTHDHMDFHKDAEEYYQAKKKLFLQGKDAAIINEDDPAGQRLCKELNEEREKTFRTLTYSMKDKRADFYGEILSSTVRGSELRMFYRGRLLGEIQTPIPGLFMAYNALAAAGCSVAAGFPFREIQKGIQALSGVPGRFEVVENPRDYLIIIDYAHTPDALENVLATAADITKGRLICVFGCGGNRDQTKRPVMGRIAGTYSDYCIITSDNPRKENQDEIASQIAEGLYETDCNYEAIADRKQAIERALSLYQKGDTILIAGKGHENYQIIGESRTHFSDRETVERLLCDNEWEKGSL